jgi:hypothetical protein
MLGRLNFKRTRRKHFLGLGAISTTERRLPEPPQGLKISNENNARGRVGRVVQGQRKRVGAEKESSRRDSPVSMENADKSAFAEFAKP